MPDLAQILTAIAALAAGGAGYAAVLSFYKRRPGEAQTEVINVGKATIEIAEGSVNVAKSAADMQREIAVQLKQQLVDIRGELKELREASGVLRKDLTATTQSLEAITRERDRLQTASVEKDAEIKRLRDRVQHLEDRVARFEA